MRRNFAPFALAAALVLPFAAVAADEGLLTKASETGFALRVAEKCGMPASALERLSDALADGIADEADDTGADRLALSQAVQAAVAQADAEFPGKPPLEFCRKVVADLEART